MITALLKYTYPTSAQSVRKGSFERGFFSTGSEVNPDAAIVKATLAAARKVGIDTDLAGFNAGSDARFLTRAGIPTLLFGSGSVEDDAHTVDKSVTVEALTEAAKAYYAVLRRFLRVK